MSRPAMRYCVAGLIKNNHLAFLRRVVHHLDMIKQAISRQEEVITYLEKIGALEGPII